MKAMVVHSPGKPFTQEEREVQQLRPGEVRIRVHACGICRSDELVTAGLWPGLELDNRREVPPPP
jgi:NADPH2:quinone reductase